MNGYITKVTGGFVLDPQGNLALGGVWICWIDTEYKMHTACVHTLGM